MPSFAPEFVCCKSILQCSAHRNYAPTASGLRRPELSIGECLCNFDGTSQKIEPLPPECQNLSDPQAREHSYSYDCVTRACRFIRSVRTCVSDKSFRSCLGSRSPI